MVELVTILSMVHTPVTIRTDGNHIIWIVGTTIAAAVKVVNFNSLLHLQYQFAGRGRVASIQATEQKMYQIDVQFADTNVRRTS